MISVGAIKNALRLERIVSQYTELKPQGKELFGRCPSAIHGSEDRTPSFTVTPDVQLWKCFGCGRGGDMFDFVKAVEGFTFQQAHDHLAGIAGLTGSRSVERKETAGGEPRRGPVVADPIPAPVTPAIPAKLVATYPYTDAEGKLLYEVLRYEPKTFRQRRPTGEWSLGDVPRVLYRLPEVLASDVVHVCEGEKDVHTLESLGLVATTNSGGSNGTWTDEMYEALRGKRVVILPDQDEPGKNRGQALLEAIAAIAESVTVVNVPEGKDVTDFVEAGGDAVALIDHAVADQRRDALERRGLLLPSEWVELAGGPAAFLSKREPGLSTGFTDYDFITGGLYGGEVTILAARPAMGKTSLAMQIATFQALHGGRPAVFSLEMGAKVLLSRTVCSEARVQLHALRTDFVPPGDRRRLQDALARISASGLLIDDNPSATLEDIERKVKFAGGVTLVVVDYLQLMASKGKTENRTQEVGAFSRGLKVLARKFNLPFLVLSQLSRANEQRAERVPQLSDLRDSGSIEQDADVVAFVHREEVYKRDREDLKGQAEVYIAKHRNGPIGKVDLRFIGAYTRFENVEKYREEEAA